MEGLLIRLQQSLTFLIEWLKSRAFTELGTKSMSEKTFPSSAWVGLGCSMVLKLDSGPV